MSITKDAVYYTSKISDNIGRTPEGYLICHAVPLSRTGMQEYLGQEIGLADKYGQIVKVYRLPEDVFEEAALASFEGKIITDEHPNGLVSLSDTQIYNRGHAQNISRSTEGDLEVMTGDLIIIDPILTDKVETGIKREVSCGYTCDYVPYKDGYRQINIRGNHIAVVKQGRAGKKVAIKDNQPDTKKRSKKPMGNKITRGFLTALGFKKFAEDAEPEEIKQAMDAMAEEAEKPKECDCKDCKVKDAEIAELKKEKEDLEKKQTEDSESEGLKGLEKFVEEEKKEGEHKASDADELTEPADGEEIAPEDRPKNPISNADSLKSLVKALLPGIAQMKDSAEKKAMIDSLNAEIRKAKGLDAKPGKNGYAEINKMVNDNKKKTTTDSQPTQDSFESYGKEIMQKYNPHYKKETK